MTVEWSRPDLKLGYEYVYILQQGREISHALNPLFKRRTSLFAEELLHGNISLKLSRVQLSDEGTFRCFVPTLGLSSLIQLLVGAVSQPVISVNGPIDDRSSLKCDSGCWYPEPEVSWLDSERNLLPAEPSLTVNRSQHCYVVRRNVTVKQAGNVTCRVHQPHINHTVEIHYDYVIPEKSLSEIEIPTARLGLIMGIVIWVAVVLILILKFMHTRKQDNNNNKPADVARTADPSSDLTRVQLAPALQNSDATSLKDLNRC